MRSAEIVFLPSFQFLLAAAVELLIQRWCVVLKMWTRGWWQMLAFIFLSLCFRVVANDGTKLSPNIAHRNQQVRCQPHWPVDKGIYSRSEAEGPGNFLWYRSHRAATSLCCVVAASAHYDVLWTRLTVDRWVTNQDRAARRRSFAPSPSKATTDIWRVTSCLLVSFSVAVHLRLICHLIRISNKQ